MARLSKFLIKLSDQLVDVTDIQLLDQLVNV